MLRPRSGDEHEWLRKHCSDTRAVKNALLEQFKMFSPELGPTPRPAERMRQLAEARNAIPWLGEGSSAVQQQAVRDFDRAAANFFAGTHRYPRWWRSGLDESFTIRDVKLRRLNRKWGETLVPKAGWVRFRITRPWAELQAATSARVKLDRAGSWTVSFTTEPPVFEREPTGRILGLDRGAVNSLATSDGELLPAPVWTDGEKDRLLGLEQRASRQAHCRKRGQKPSSREKQTRRNIGRLHGKLTDRRTDWVEQTTTRLVRDYDLIVVEALNTTGMVKRPAPKQDPERPGVFLPNQARAKAKLNRMIHASLWGRVERRSADKTAASGTAELRRVNPAYTSQQCPQCGHTTPKNRESQADFRCVNCGHQQHADINAARNILTRGQQLAPTSGGLCGRTARERASKPTRKRGNANYQPTADTERIQA
ncbi:MAG: RNA-guided endonuclease InsQ/TnpB family protein [Solirubrobacteraceae bacterium]